MDRLAETAGAMLSRAGRVLETSAQNVANMTTPGYKTRRSFAATLQPGQSPQIPPAEMAGSDLAAGKLMSTGNPLDLAIAGEGFFTVRSGDALFYTRNGQFVRDGEGRLVTADGMILQSAAGDVVTETADVIVTADGVVTDGGAALARLSIARFDDSRALRAIGATLFAAPADAADEVAVPHLRQGMLESSNVDTAAEMLAVMAALRSAESGQKIIQTYDDLMGKALTAFSPL